MQLFLSIHLLFFSIFFPFSFKNNITEKPLKTIAFGSCNNIWQEQPIWKNVVQNNPGLWIWLGDNIYGDTNDMAYLEEQYQVQKEHKDYQMLLKQVPVIGVWDDHDYGRNDAGKEYPYKEQSKKLLLDFLDVPESAEVYQHKGVYQQYTYGSGKQKVKIILLDGRTFRDPINIKFGLKLPNRKGELLGEAQWQWLEKQLRNSDAAIHIIACGIQFLPKHNQYEKWGNFPKDRKRLLNLIAATKPSGLILLSGDRHMAELSSTEIKNYPHPINELTSSGLTHYKEKSYSLNLYRVGEQVNALNFGLLHFDWQPEKVKVSLEIRGIENKLYLQKEFIVPLTKT